MIEKILNRILNNKDIVNCNREIYLRRWYVLRSRWLGVFIHKFIRSDEDRGGLHDHPWNFIVIPVWRGYIEHNLQVCRTCGGKGRVYAGAFIAHVDGVFPTVECQKCGGEGKREGKTRVYPIISARYRPATYRHRVELFEQTISEHTRSIIPKFNAALPAWSIFIRFRKVRDWGFWMPGGFVQWAAFWKEKCE